MMELNFKVQHNDELMLDKMFQRQTKRQNRHHIVEDMMQINEAEKEAKEEIQRIKNLKKPKKKKSVFRQKYEKSVLKKYMDKIGRFFKAKLYAVKSALLYLWYLFLDGIDGLNRRKYIYIGILGCILLGVLVVSGYKYLFGFEVTYNGKPIGVVENLETFENAMENVDSNLIRWYENDSVFYEQSVSMRRTFIRDRNALLDEKTCEDAIYACDIPLFYQGGVVTVDGIETVRLASVDDAKHVVNILVGKETLPGSTTEQLLDSKIEQKVKAEEKIVAIGTERTVEDAVNYMFDLSQGKADINDGNTPQNPLAEVMMAEENGEKGLITALNFRKDDFSVGRFETKPTLTIETVKEVIYNEAIAYKTVYEDDANEYIGTTKDKVPGKKGTKKITAIIKYVNGKEESREIIDQKVEKKPVARIVARGTKPLPPASSTGLFLMPATGSITTIEGTSSHAGGRALDIANHIGTNIYASDSGVIVSCGWRGTYGNAIEIDHGNGYSTLYAHLSGFNAKVGQQVGQGQVIGYMGSTGYSTGSHLHFEIRYKGDRMPIRRYFSDLALGIYVNALK